MTLFESLHGYASEAGINSITLKIFTETSRKIFWTSQTWLVADPDYTHSVQEQIFTFFKEYVKSFYLRIPR